MTEMQNKVEEEGAQLDAQEWLATWLVNFQKHH